MASISAVGSASPSLPPYIGNEKASFAAVHRRFAVMLQSRRRSAADRLLDQSDGDHGVSSSRCHCGESCGVVHLGVVDRRALMISSVGALVEIVMDTTKDGAALAGEFADMPALRGKDYGKTKMKYPDYTETESGLQYKDLRVGAGPTPKIGETVVVDWDGYTIGYYGRIFEARNKTKGGSFEGDDKEFFKFTLGSNQVIPAFEEALFGMAQGGVRRIIVPPELGYPDNDYNKSGPRPTTFSGQRALSFVLKNQGLIDKTLLFDIELLKILPTAK